MENDFWAKSQTLCKLYILYSKVIIVQSSVRFVKRACERARVCVHLCILKTFCPLYQANIHNNFVMHRLHCNSTSYSDLKLHRMPWYWHSAKQRLFRIFIRIVSSPGCEKESLQQPASQPLAIAQTRIKLNLSGALSQQWFL